MVDIIYTKDLILRKAKESDLNKIFENVWSDEVLTRTMLWKVTNNIEDAEERMKRTIKYQSENLAFFVSWKETNEPIGFAGIYEKENGTYEDSGLCIAKNYQKRGYGKQVVEAFMKLIFEKLNGNKFIYSCFSTNENSRKVCIHFGFKYFESKKTVRDYDNEEFDVDYYYMDKEMYEEYLKKIR